MKATAIAPANTAVIKYWGRKDEKLRLPINGSLSYNCSNLLTTTTIEYQQDLQEDVVIIDGDQIAKESTRVSEHVDRIRSIAGIDLYARIESKNSFPTGTGLSSSSSGFAALTMAALEAGGIQLPNKDISIVARQGSGSACRSIDDGWVEWKDAKTSDQSFGVQIFDEDHFDIRDIVAVVSTDRKLVSSSDGHKTAETSMFFDVRKTHIQRKLEDMKQVIEDRNFSMFGEMTEKEALEFHSIAMTSNPSLLYLQPWSLALMQQIQAWRRDGLEVYFNVNTGQDVHVLCQPKDEQEVLKHLCSLDYVQDTIVNSVGKGTRIVEDHLF